MKEGHLQDFLKKIQIQTDMKKKSELIVWGCSVYFPFQRACIFSYSPFSSSIEGIYLVEKEQISTLESMKTDVHSIPPIYQAVTQNTPLFINSHETQTAFPEQIIHEYNLTSVIVVPITILNVSTGFLLLDGFNGSAELLHQVISQLSKYVTLAAAPLLVVTAGILSKRESEVLQHLANGYDINGIAEQLFISKYTVRDYLSSAVRKLGVRHRSEAVAVGIRTGMIV